MKHPRHARGMALVEAMVAAALLAVGVLGAARLSLHAQASLREGRAQSHAHILASQALACALAHPSPCPSTEHVLHAGMRYSVTLERTALSAELQALQVNVEWAPENGAARTQRLRWQTRRSSLPDWLGLSSP
ncbi:MAG: hypothetical protein FJY36_03765 [Betaproteobacteria bacterium]|nr:hypothetical protein [Betaproteobacteria bacterium]